MPDPIAVATPAPSVLSGLPAWAQFVAWIGLPAAAFGWYLYAIGPRLDAMERAVTELTRTMQQQNDIQWAILSVQQRTCLNVSKTDLDRVACVAITKRVPQ